MDSSDSDSDSEWNREFLTAVSKKRGKGGEISEENRCKQMQECLYQGADVNTAGKSGNTALHMAVKKGYQEVVRFLLRNGARTDIVNQQDYTAITLAEYLNENEIASILKQPFERQSEQLARPVIQFTPVDNARPSTSRDGTFLVDDQSNESRPVITKRKLTPDHKCDESGKKPRFVLNDPPQFGRHSNITVTNAAGGTSLVGDPHHEEDTGRIIQPPVFDGEETYAASGLKRSLHGVVYQWKHLMLILHRARRMGYSFRLATEMDAAEKFDDVVLEYEDRPGNKVHRFVQVKHKQDETDVKMVSATHLLDVKDGEFSMLKYFLSWRKIKRNLDFSGSISKKFFLCTNIGLDLEGLKVKKIDVTEVGESDNFLNATIRTELAPRFYKLVNSPSELWDTLKFASDVHRLARELVERVCGSKDIFLNTEMIRCYHLALAQEVIDIENEKLSLNFIRNNGLSERAENFRGIFFFHAKKIFPRNASDNDIWKSLGGNKLKLSANFGPKIELNKLELTNVGRFSDEFVKLVNNASSDNVVKIDRRIYSKRASDASKKVVADNIDKLAGHVLIMENKKIKFNSKFLNDSTQSLGDIEKFKDALKIKLGSKFDELDKLEFEINNFRTCTEEELAKIELPNDEIDDREFSDFLNEFILAVNQPNEVELGEMIKLEIGAYSQFNLLNVDFIGGSFQNAIVEWLKKTGKYSKFLSNEDAEDFFIGIERELSSLVTVGLNLPYTAELKKYDIKFDRELEDLRNFLDGSNSSRKPILELISSEKTLLTALKVYQTLDRIAEYKKNDSLIFIHLEKLLLPDIMKQVSRAFESSRSHHLLVIDCESISVNLNAQMLWNRLSNIMNRNGNKRMVLIIQGNTGSVIQFQIGFVTSNEIDNCVSIDNLKYRSRYKLLNKMIVKFQGHEEKTSFGRLLSSRMFDGTTAQRLTTFEPIIDSNTLVRLIKDEEIQIGGELKGLSDIKNFYISRTIVRHVVIKKDILRAPGINDLFVLSGIDRRSLEKLVAGDESTRSSRENNQTEVHLNECIILDNNRVPDDFQSLCKQNSNRNIHWLQAGSGRFIWKRSIGDITNLMAYKEARHAVSNNIQPGATYLTEGQLLDHDEQRRIVILSDRAGMGKTTVLTYLAGKMKQNESNLLVIMIELTRHTTVLAEEQEKRTFDSNNTNGAVDFLVDKLTSLGTNLERETFKAIIKVRGEAALLFDGFDEISPTYKDTVIDLLQALAKLRIKKLYVTTRPHTSKPLEQTLGIFSHTLLPFSVANQIEFLTKFWRKDLRSNELIDMTDRNIKKHARAVLKILTTSINHQMQEFAGVPLQTRLVAEAFPYVKKEERKYLDASKVIPDSEDNPLRKKLPEKINLIDLYGLFVDEKYKIFCKEKKPGDRTNLAEIQVSKVTHQMFLISHQKLALDALFDEETVKAMLSCQPEIDMMCSLFNDTSEDRVRTGIVTQVISGKPYFIHRTFAEYFAAIFLTNTLKDDNRNQQVRKFFVAQLFVEPEHKTIRAFLNCLLLGKSLTLDKRSWEFDLSKNCDADRRTLYHIAADESNFEIVRFFINRLTKNRGDPRPHHITENYGREDVHITAVHGHGNESNLPAHHDHVEGNPPNTENRMLQLKNSLEQDADINLRDKFGSTALAITMNKLYNLDVVTCFAEGGADVNCKCTFGETPLHIASKKPDNSDIVYYLIKKGANINSQNKSGTTPLHSAVSATGNLEIVKYLIDKGADINSLDNSSWTPLHNAVRNLDVVEHLVEKGANIHCQNGAGYTPLYYATIKSIEVAKYLIEKGAAINHQQETGMTVLHYATGVPRQLDMIKHLVENGADINCQTKDGYTPLYCAVIHTNNLDVVKYLIEKGADVNFQQQTGMTVLHYAAIHAGDLDIVEYLVGKGANINCQDKDGFTPLYYAAFQATHLNVVKYLIEKGANVNIQGEHGKTPLHNAAVALSNFNMVKYLIDKDANIHAQEITGLTPLYHAAGVGNNFNVIELLIEKGANVNFQGERGDSPLHNAVDVEDNLNTVKYLIEKGAKVNIQNEHGKTPLHNATLINDNLDVVKYLIDNGANINSQDDHGKTPLHNAAGVADNFELVKYLLHEGADINAQESLGLTPLYYAARVDNNSELGKYLIERGAEVNSQSKHGETPLHNAALTAGNLDLVNCLIEKGAGVNSQGENGKTPLHNAALVDCNLDLVKYLIVRGANINSPDQHGKTPLHNAASVADNINIVEHLVEKGANIDSQDTNGLTPLYYAAGVYTNSDIVKYLIERGANVRSQGVHGDTPLHNAAIAGDLDSAVYLIEKGAVINSEGEHCKTPLHNAAGGSGNLDMVKYLIQKGANNNSCDTSGLTPLNYAAGIDNNLDVVKYLIEISENIHS